MVVWKSLSAIIGKLWRFTGFCYFPCACLLADWQYPG